MKITLLSLLLLFALHQSASAKASFMDNETMIRNAKVIAIITISDVRKISVKGQYHTYQQSGTARVEAVLKGQVPPEFTLYGDEDFICAQCQLSPGRYLAFLKEDLGLWAGVNWHLSLRPMKGSSVDWYVRNAPSSDVSRTTLTPTPLSDIIAQIKTTQEKPDTPH